MNQQLLPNEIALLAKPVMDRRDKLLRFADVVRSHHDRPFGLYHHLEHKTPWELTRTGLNGSAFEAALADPILLDAGLTGNNISDMQRFFDLSTIQLHEFSCDCGGAISNEDMADRIENLAGPAPIVVDSKSWTG